MLFNSYIFLFAFLPVTLAAYYILLRFKQLNLIKIMLLGASLIFYGYERPINIYIIIVSIVVNYCIYLRLIGKRNKAILILGLAFNILWLGYFKYTNFIVGNLKDLLGVAITMKKVILPLGISFFTFEQIGFIVDIYRNNSIRYKFLDYCVFITFFPHLAAGPIISHDEIIPQIEKKLGVNYESICKGMFLFSIGLSKKILLADFLASKAALGFDTLQSLTFFQGWITSICYTLQLFFDFSGYSDMAIGLGMMFNIKLPFNFKSPYKARSIKEFWNTWHITLGKFLAKYIYFPLGGNRKGKLRTYLNLFIVFFISGIWHGAGWTFIVWGIMHGIAIVINRIWTDLGLKMNKFLAWFITINFVNAAWVFFRAKDFDSALKVLKAMFNVANIKSVQNLSQFGGKGFLIILVLMIILVLFSKSTSELVEKFSFSKKWAFVSGVLLTVAILSISKMSKFIYFNF